MLDEDLDPIPIDQLKADYKRIKELHNETNKLYRKYIYSHELIDGRIYSSMRDVIEKTLGRKLLNSKTNEVDEK
ncbi:MAG: hypothetical protein GWN01_05515 [Nitrosopumilaceae archaeon]|nr:hypothetical protein [Nitrosopumilaceae archaeon]NIU86804.1 hypothetical protein [Nitrosopumilaceae archaeon]NIX61003.1 hypothetical protein [Nitrosopumilaceae archaeon]